MKRVVILLFTFSWSFVCAVHRKGQHQILRTNHKSFPNKSEKPNTSSEEGMSKSEGTEGASKSEEGMSKFEKCEYYTDDTFVSTMVGDCKVEAACPKQF